MTATHELMPCVAVCCGTCKNIEAYGRKGHHICKHTGIIFRGMEPTFTICEDWEPI